MVRAHVKQSPEEKKEAAKKKAAAAKKKSPSETGVWPCKINGCNKQFAREADLKRHQRTTKLHSTPGFRCPQCDATFTRTDALRRHQKSRHNGVVIEPGDSEMKNGEGSSGSKSRSRSGTPAPTGEKPLSASANASPSAAGPSSYYRPHTMHAGYAPPPSGVGVESHYSSSIGLPTSATRTNWSAPPAWQPEGGPPQMGQYQAFYQPPGPSPYYRSATGGPPDGSQPPPPGDSIQAQNGPAPGAEGTPTNGPGQASAAVVDPQLAHGDVVMKDDAGNAKSASAPVIDPALEGGNSAPSAPAPELEGGPKPVTMQMTAAAMQAVIAAITPKPEEAKAPAPVDAAPSAAAEDKSKPMPAPSSGQVADPASTAVDAQNIDTEAEADADGEADIDPQLELQPAVQEDDNVIRPPAMEPMVTEDGEPMLNPAELLTQESLASPPPV